MARGRYTSPNSRPCRSSSSTISGCGSCYTRRRKIYWKSSCATSARVHAPHVQSTSRRLGQPAGRYRGRHRPARSPAPSRARAQVRAAQLADESADGLAERGPDEVELTSLDHPPKWPVLPCRLMAGFQMSTEARFLTAPSDAGQGLVAVTISATTFLGSDRRNRRQGVAGGAVERRQLRDRGPGDALAAGRTR